MCNRIIYILLILNGYVTASSVADSWILFSKALKDSFNNCPVKLEMFDCLRRSSLEVFDKMITSDVIPLTSDVRLERYRYDRKMSFASDSDEQQIHNNVWKRNDTSLTKESWSGHVLRKAVNLLKTHTLNIDLIPRSSARRRHRNQMLPMMIAGVTALGIVTIPMGFQFLAVLGGKALLLAKMALMLAMMNGLKRVANSGVHYGLYHSEPHHHGYHYMDRGDMDKGDINRPRSTKI